MATPRRLLLLSPLPPPSGGMATWTQGILDSSLAREFEIEVINTSPLSENVESVSRFRLGRAWRAIRILGQVASAMLLRRPDVIHVNTPYGWAMLRDGLVLWAAWLFAVPRVLHFHGGDFESFARGLPRPAAWLLRRTLRRATRLVAITRETEAFLIVWIGAAAVVYVPNFVKLDEASGAPLEAREPPVRLRFLFVGWLLPAKGVVELLEAAGRLPGADFTLVGPYFPDFRPELLDRIRDAGDHVELLGPMPHAEVIEAYRKADVFVLPSHREGFPMVVLEAMALGLPVVATTVGAIADVVRDGVDGFVVTPRDVDSLVERLERYVAEPSLARSMGSNAARRARECFELEVVVDELEVLYSEILEERRTA